MAVASILTLIDLVNLDISQTADCQAARRPVKVASGRCYLYGEFRPH